MMSSMDCGKCRYKCRVMREKRGWESTSAILRSALSKSTLPATEIENLRPKTNKTSGVSAEPPAPVPAWTAPHAAAEMRCADASDLSAPPAPPPSSY